MYISGHILTVKSPAALFPFSAFYRLSLFSGPSYLTPPALYLLLFPLSERKAYTPYQWNISLDLSGGRLFSLGVSCPCFIHQTGPVYLPAKEQWGAQIIRNESRQHQSHVLQSCRLIYFLLSEACFSCLKNKPSYGLSGDVAAGLICQFYQGVEMRNKLSSTWVLFPAIHKSTLAQTALSPEVKI